jgi:hypothetical protein
MKVRLERLSSNHEHLRTDTVTGICDSLPVVGYSFEMWAESLDPSKDVRYIVTSKVLVVFAEDLDVIDFNTANSKYSLVLLEEE